MSQHIQRRDPQSRSELGNTRNRLLSFASGQRQAAQSVEIEDFVSGMRGAVNGVNIVTTHGPAGRFGITVSAFSSVSAEPPTVLICVNRRSPACKAILENGQFCVNVLAIGQRKLADVFAGYPATGEAYDFGRGSWNRAVTGAPLLENSVASFDCTVGTSIDVGSHSIFIGLVRAVERSNARPLLYTNGSYGRACCGI